MSSLIFGQGGHWHSIHAVLSNSERLRQELRVKVSKNTYGSVWQVSIGKVVVEREVSAERAVRGRRPGAVATGRVTRQAARLIAAGGVVRRRTCGNATTVLDVTTTVGITVVRTGPVT